MRRLRSISIVLVASAAFSTAAGAAPSRTVKAATAAENAAFGAIDEGRWCDAVRLFLQADALAPNATLLENSAEAAVESGDLQLAVELFERAWHRTTGKQRRALKRRWHEIKSQAKRSPAGGTCSLEAPGITSSILTPPPQKTAGEKTVANAPDAMAASERSNEAEKKAATRESRVAQGLEVQTTSTSSAPDAEAGWPRFLVSTALGGTALAGTLGVIGGGIFVTIGALPWFRHAQARADLEAAAMSGADGSALQAEQQVQRAAWESYGGPTLVAGLMLSTVGLGVVIAAGSALAASLLWPTMAVEAEES